MSGSFDKLVERKARLAQSSTSNLTLGEFMVGWLPEALSVFMTECAYKDPKTPDGYKQVRPVYMWLYMLSQFLGALDGRYATMSKSWSNDDYHIKE